MQWIPESDILSDWGVTSFHLAYSPPQSVELLSKSLRSRDSYAWEKEQLPQQHVFVPTAYNSVSYQFLTSYTLGDCFCFWHPLISNYIQANSVKSKGKVTGRTPRKWTALGPADGHLLYPSSWAALEQPSSVASGALWLTWVSPTLEGQWLPGSRRLPPPSSAE